MTEKPFEHEALCNLMVSQLLKTQFPSAGLTLLEDEFTTDLLTNLAHLLSYRGQACYCLDRAIRADPEDIALRYHRASLYVELGEHHKAAESYEQIWQVRPKNVKALKTAATLYQKGGKHERSVNILENYMNKNPKDADLSVVSLLASMLMSANEHEKALHHIEYTQRTCSSGKELPAELLIIAGICHVHLGNMKNAEDFFSVFTHENVNDCAHLVIEVADSILSVKHHESALKYCLMFEGIDVGSKGLLYLNIGRCYSFLCARTPAIHYLYKALHEREEDIDARLDLVSLLLEEDKEDESIFVLSPPLDSESRAFPKWLSHSTVMDIDSVGTFTMCHTALNYLKKGGPGRTDDTGGLILNISATLHYTASWYQIHVSAAKAVVDAITRNLALEWGTDYDIRVNDIAPGPISDTPGMRKLGPDEIESKRTKEIMPLFKLGEKSDIAFATLYLASNAGNYVNGTTLIVDGGLWLSRPRHMAKDEVKMISRLVEKHTRAAPSSKL